ncbi:GNAT family N-acetyltransferase [Plantactinospora sp. S1510]|uniref:GNAT family N-acetyltransferase n=1 Tax=Plantactinospora alkalitolerans TaxID=2789879 RepID=A0ABS0H1X7_9ACTN|nr:GNAT family N-acetyltransferase [Plantactinospora alkalitolerans]MBF9132457.1 GNAT family N-acetyltransferase [Plantactinospora alkalitolerans]
MGDLRFETVRPDGDNATRADWQYVHNLIIPTGPLSAEEVRARAHRNRLNVTYHGDTLVGCSTVRPPTGDQATATVIVRVLPEHRRQGFGGQMYDKALTAAYEVGARVVETVVLASNEEGLRFAERHGYVEVDRYVLDGDTIPFIDLRLAVSGVGTMQV